MHAILVESCSEDIVSALIRAGADVNAKDNGQQWTPLAFAARDGKLRICELLLESGAEIDSIDLFGNTPLWRAVFGSKHEVVNFLVQQGANLDRPNRRGVTPRSILDGAGGG